MLRIPVPEIVPSGVFPITPDYGSGLSVEPEIKVVRFQSGNARSSSVSCWAAASASSWSSGH
jgi:hypothetical protein